MCWFHMKACVKKHLPLINDKETATRIYTDVNRLQLASTQQQFDAASKLFLKKWSVFNVDGLPAFLKYFETEWIKVRIQKALKFN